MFNILENNFEVIVVNAQHISKVPGRKTDQSDAEWIAELMQYGLLKASFIPPDGQLRCSLYSVVDPVLMIEKRMKMLKKGRDSAVS